VVLIGPNHDFVVTFYNLLRVNIASFLKNEMPTFKRGEKVRIIDGHKKSYTTYIIKDSKKGKNGTVLYLLKSQEDSTLRLYCESKETLLERTA